MNGSICRVCTGCGRCMDEKQKIQILTKGPGERIIRPFLGDGKVRLVTADVGTTTIAMLLYRTDGSVEDYFVTVNPQTVYGADVLSRILAAENPKNAKRQKEMVRDVLGQGIRQFQKYLSDGESLQMVLAANTTMMYLLMGWDTKELGRAPFSASRLGTVRTKLEGVPCYIFQGLSAFVGGDVTAGILACEMTVGEEITLLVDLGTNGEMVLGNSKKLIACSAAAGPAFEGGASRGVWGADMVRILAALRQEGLIDETGLLADPFFEEGVFAGGVLVTQETVRAIQLAKGAVMAGISILLKEYGIGVQAVDRVVLAGGFGYYLNPKDAAGIRLLPQELVSKARTGGNTALAGALCMGRMLLEGKEPAPLPQVRILNLAEHGEFQRHYLDGMSF